MVILCFASFLVKCCGISSPILTGFFFPTLSLCVFPWKLPNPVKNHPANNSEKVYRLRLWEIPQRIHHQICAPNGNDSRNVQGPEGRRKVKNLCSEVHYLNIQDCAGGLGHRVLMWGLPWGKAVAVSVRHTQLPMQLKKEESALGVTAPSAQSTLGTYRLAVKWKLQRAFKADHQGYYKRTSERLCHMLELVVFSLSMLCWALLILFLGGSE